MIKDFAIPLSKDELLENRNGQYYVQTVLPVRMLQQALEDARLSQQAKGIDFLFEHFDTFFSIIVHENKVELQITMRAFNRIHKAFEILVLDMESLFEKDNELEEETRLKFLNLTKMLAYLVSWYICHIDEQIRKNATDKYVGKRKRSAKSDTEDEWEKSRDKVLEYSYRLLQLPLQKLWKPPIVEDMFVALLTKVCYRFLEQCKDSKMKHTRQTIFEILGTSIKRYNHGISCIVRIVQLVKLDELLAVHMSAGVIQMINDCGCKGLIREINKEIERSDPTEADSRNISIFLENIAISDPKVIIPILENLMCYLESDHYTMRNCIISVLGEVVKQSLTGDDLTQEQKDQRDECLNAIDEHILDNNSYVRSKVLQVWLRLCREGAIPLARQGKLLARIALRLEDKSAIVRKHALQLIRELLENNPFAAKLNKVELSKSLEKEEIKLSQLQSESVSKSGCGDKQRLELWNNFLPQIRKALDEVIKSESNQENNCDDEEDDIDLDTAFEHIRQLMLKEKILDAVKHLWKICVKLKETPDLENLSPEAKEECLFLFLLKIFMESENVVDDTNKNKEDKQSAGSSKETEQIEAAKCVVNYLKNCLEFATELEMTIPIAEKLLFSTTASDAIGACSLLGTASQFDVAGAAEAAREALFQVFHRDQSVRDNIAMVYKELHLHIDENKKTERQKALACVKTLTELLRGLQPGQSQALTHLILSWYNNNYINNEVLQVLWEKFSMKSADTNPLDSRSALMLLTMISQAQNGIIINNLDVLIKIGLGPRAKEDLLLARDTCRALLSIKHQNDDIEKPPLRYPNDHEMFNEIMSLLIENFTNTKEDGYISFATDAISVIYHLANQPDHLIKHLLQEVFVRGHFNSDSSQNGVSCHLLSKLLYLIGHIAIREMVHLDLSVYKELKRRDTIRMLKKGKNSNKNHADLNKSNLSVLSKSARQSIRSKDVSLTVDDNGEEAVQGAADDANAEFINDTLENHVVTGDGLLVAFIPLVFDVCRYHDKYNNEDVQAAAVSALTKMMTVSSIFCEESLQLLITILERSPYPGIRSNVLIGITDLITRFPNEVEPWMRHIYGRLRDSNTDVRRTCVRVLSRLVMREMVRVRGQISELAPCIIDNDIQIRQDAKQFFKALSQKGNTLYNVMPDILSRLTDPTLDLSEANFQEIVKYILKLLQKEKQVDAIIEKICARFKLATTERQWRDFSYCLSLLEFSPKSIYCLIESLPQLKDKINNKQVLKSLQVVVEQTKKKPSTKAVSAELEAKMEELFKNTNNANQDDNKIMPPPPAPKTKKRSMQKQRRSSSEEEEDEDEDSDTVVSGKKSLQALQKEKQNYIVGSANEKTPTKTPSKSEGSTPLSAVRNRSGRKRNDATPISTPSSLPKKNRKVSVSVDYTPKRSSARLSQLRVKH